MSCYLHHMSDLFDEAGIEVTKENRKQIDAHIAGIVGDAKQHCPTTWRLVKEWRADPERRAQLIAGLQRAAG